MNRQHLPRRRQRLALSCLSCRSRKVKCDRKTPCGPCASTSRTCVYRAFNTPEPFDASSGVSGVSFDDSPTYLLGHGYGPTGHGSEVETAGHPQASTYQDGEVNIMDLWRRVQTLEEASRAGQGAAGVNVSALGTYPSDPPGTMIIMNKTQMMRFPLGVAAEFTPIIASYAAVTETKPFLEGNDNQVSSDINTVAIDTARQIYRNCKSISAIIKTNVSGHAKGGDELVIPDRSTAEIMITLYFRCFESTYRILHEPTFRNELEVFWSDTAACGTELRLKVQLVTAIGSSVHDHGDHSTDFRRMIHRWIHAAQNWLTESFEKGRLSISALQVDCLTILARQIFSIGETVIWVSTGSLIHKAMQMGLHRDPKHLPAMSMLDSELRRRLWATIMELAVQSTLSSCMPARIALDDFDTEPPSNIHDRDIDEASSSVQSQSREVYTDTSIQLLLLDSLPLRLRILRLINGIGSHLNYTEVLSMSAELIRQCETIHRFHKDNEQRGLMRFHRNMLDYIMRQFIYLLHIPFATKAQTEPELRYSMNVCIDNSMATIAPLPDEAFSRFMVHGEGLFKEGFKNALTVLGLELLVRVQAQQRDGTLQSNPHYVNTLRTAIKELMMLSEERIQHGKTQVKIHLFLSMILSQAHAIEVCKAMEPVDLERVIVHGAIESLELCYNILETRAIAAEVIYDQDTNLPSGIFEGEPEDWVNESGLDFLQWFDSGISQ